MFVIGLVIISLFFLPKSTGHLNSAIFRIEAGQSVRSISTALKNDNLIYSQSIFRLYVKLFARDNIFKSGNFKLSAEMSVYSLVNLFTQGNPEPEDIIIVVPEGTNIADLGKILQKAKLAQEGDLLKSEFLQYEGTLFPDTYRFKPETSLTEIINEMRDNFLRRTESVLTTQNIRERQEIIVIASILEKEVRSEEDMKIVAGIINSRMKLGIPLQLDATVAYGVCYGKFLIGKYCDVSRANIVDNISVDSVYNTYTRRGLPSGAISNPGVVAIKAVLNPIASSYLYYLSKKDGSTVFSRTAREHEAAKRKYLTN